MFIINQNTETILIGILVYLFLVITFAKLGTYKICGGSKAFLVSFFLTPVIGVLYVMVSPRKLVQKIVHYRCNHCRLEYTTSHKYCKSCAKDGKKYRLEKRSMRTY